MAVEKNKQSILDYFPSHMTMRDVQRDTLLAIEKEWDRKRVFVVNLPVASGKSAIAITLARWAGEAAITTPTKLLVNQYLEDYPHTAHLFGMGDYHCKTTGTSIAQRKKAKLHVVCDNKYCKGCQDFKKDIISVQQSNQVLGNFHVYMARKKIMSRPVLIADEAHQIIPVLKELSGKHIWCFKHRMPTHFTTRQEIKEWINSLEPVAFTYHYNLDGSRVDGTPQDKLSFLKQELNSKTPSYLVRMGKREYEEEEYDCVEMEPVDLRNIKEGRYMWPAYVEKIILLSATLSEKDVEQLGLMDDNAVYLSSPSVIPAEQRPVVIPAERVNLSYKTQDENIPKLIDFINKIAQQFHDKKGLIHTTYSLSSKIRKELYMDDRFIFHNKANKSKQYKLFRESKEPKILVASGMYEGIDLPYDLGRWQILAKVPWPSLAEPAIRYLSSIDPDYYRWETVKTVLQACGRICRTPDDYGVTYITDSSFLRLLETGNKMFPDWWKQSVNIEPEREVENECA